jgi:hypothetical protein
VNLKLLKTVLSKEQSEYFNLWSNYFLSLFFSPSLLLFLFFRFVVESIVIENKSDQHRHSIVTNEERKKYGEVLFLSTMNKKILKKIVLFSFFLTEKETLKIFFSSALSYAAVRLIEDWNFL